MGTKSSETGSKDISTGLALPNNKPIELREMSALQVKAVDAHVEKEFAKIKANPVGERKIYLYNATDAEDLASRDPRKTVPVAEILKDQPQYLKQLIRSDVTGINLGEIDPTGNDKENKKLMDKNNQGKVDEVTKGYVQELMKKSEHTVSGNVPHKPASTERKR